MSSAVRAACTQMMTKANAIYAAEEIEARVTKLAKLYDDGRATEALGSTGVTVNEVYPRVRTAMAAYFAKRPEILTRPQTPEDAQAAEMDELLLNYLVRAQKYTRELRDWLWYSRLFMFGAIKIGMDGKDKRPRLPTLSALDPRTVRFDPTLDRLRPEGHRWAACKHQRSLKSLRVSGMYKDKDLDKLVDAIVTKNGGEMPPEEESVDIWIWEHYLLNGKDVVIATTASGFNGEMFSQDEQVWVREEEYTAVAGIPIRLLAFMPSVRKYYPTSPVEPWLDQLKEVVAFRNNKLAHADRAIRKLWVSEEVEEAERAKLSTREPMTWLVTPTGKRGDDLFGEIPVGQLDTAIYEGERDAENTITLIDGIGAPQLGQQPNRGSNSATRDAISEQYLRLRSSDNQEVWEDALEDLFQGVLHTAQGYMEGSVWLSATGMPPVELKRANIAGSVDVMLSFGSTLPRDREKEKAEASDLFKMFAGNPTIDQSWLMRKVLIGYGVRDLDHAMVQVKGPGMSGGPDVLAPPPGAPGAPPLNGLPGNSAAAVQQVGAGSRGASPLGAAQKFRQVK